MNRTELIFALMDTMEAKGYGLVAIRKNGELEFPTMLATYDNVESLIFVEMTDEIFENGLSSLEGIEYVEASLKVAIGD